MHGGGGGDEALHGRVLRDRLKVLRVVTPQPPPLSPHLLIPLPRILAAERAERVERVGSEFLVLRR